MFKHILVNKSPEHLPADYFHLVHHYVKPVCGVTFSTSPGFRLDSSTLVLTSVKGAMHYPDFLTSPQTQLLCSVLGQLRSTELITGMLDPSTGKSVSYQETSAAYVVL